MQRKSRCIKITNKYTREKKKKKLSQSIYSYLEKLKNSKNKRILFIQKETQNWNSSIYNKLKFSSLKWKNMHRVCYPGRG